MTPAEGLRLRGFQQSRCRQTKFIRERTADGIAGAVLATPESTGRMLAAGCKILTQLFGMAIVDIDVDRPRKQKRFVQLIQLLVDDCRSLFDLRDVTRQA